MRHLLQNKQHWVINHGASSEHQPNMLIYTRFIYINTILGKLLLFFVFDTLVFVRGLVALPLSSPSMPNKFSHAIVRMTSPIYKPTANKVNISERYLQRFYVEKSNLIKTNTLQNTINSPPYGPLSVGASCISSRPTATLKKQKTQHMSKVRASTFKN